MTREQWIAWGDALGREGWNVWDSAYGKEFESSDPEEREETLDLFMRTAAEVAEGDSDE